jgi:hypothetical protein
LTCEKIKLTRFRQWNCGIEGESRDYDEQAKMRKEKTKMRKTRIARLRDLEKC